MLSWRPHESISACAESSLRALRALPCVAVYLRVCGVILLGCLRDELVQSLSPRVRSHLLQHRAVVVAVESISACAESSGSWPLNSNCSGVYLRVCGVIVLNFGGAHSPPSLSPRVRSHPIQFQGHAPTAESISACAESSSTSVTRFVEPGVYLRVCGVIPDFERRFKRFESLSPRVRSHLRTPAPRPERRKSISACAESSPAVPASSRAT